MTSNDVISIPIIAFIDKIDNHIDIIDNIGIPTIDIIGIIGQRLVRQLCSHCKTSHTASDLEKNLLGIQSAGSLEIFDANGCERCGDIGYKGRIAILEVLKVDSDLDEMIAEQVTLGKIKQHLKQNGFQSLADDAARRVIEGVTTLDEVSRVIDLTDRL